MESKTLIHTLWLLVLVIVAMAITIFLQARAMDSQREVVDRLQALLEPQFEAEALWCTNKGAMAGTVRRDDKIISVWCSWPHRGADGIFYPPRGGER